MARHLLLDLANNEGPFLGVFNIPESVIDGVAAEIHSRTNRDYKIPIVGVPTNLETPQVFEIMPFESIDDSPGRFYAIDGSRNSHSLYNGITLCFYQAGYVCFRQGQQIRLNVGNDPVVLGKLFHGTKMLVLNDEDLSDIYNEFLSLPTIVQFLTFLDQAPQDVFPYNKEAVTGSASTLLNFCQEVLEFACIYDIAASGLAASGDFILRDGALRTLNIRQRCLVKLGYFLHARNIRLVGVTKQSPVKTELAYTFSKIDSYLQGKLKPQYPFKSTDPKRQKLCCYFEVRDDVLDAAYSGSSSAMYAKKDIHGGRGVGLFFAARLDYVEKLQNYDWLLCDLNIYDCIPGIGNRDTTRDPKRVAEIMYALTATTQEHYILGYPYPLVEAHNLVSLTSDFKEEAIARVKSTLYSTQQMDHTDIENLFIDLHSRF
jgi:hypothetical protein